MTSRMRFFMTTAAVALAWQAPALAQEAEAPVASDGDIIVTAQRRAQSLQDTPVAVSAFNENMMQERGIVNVESIAASTPGLYISQGTSSPSTLQIAMRGAMEQNGGTITSESPVGIYIDDVYQSRLSAANYDLAEIERIEVLRGPQGTLYGRNSMTGAIKIVTRQPNGDTWLNTDLSYARFNEYRGKVNAGTALNDNLAVAASAFYNKRADGWQYNQYLDKHQGTHERYGAQLALGITNVPRFEATLTGRYLETKSDGQHFMPMDVTPGNGFPNQLPFYHTNTPKEAVGDNTQYSLSLKMGYDLFDNMKLKSISAYQHMEDRWALDFGGGVDLGEEVVVGFFRDSSSFQRQFTQELQLQGDLIDGNLNYIFGAFFFDEKARQTTVGDELPVFGSVALPGWMNTTSKSTAFYAQFDYKVLPSLTATVGLRHTSDKKTFEGVTQDQITGLNEPVQTKIDAKVWTPKFNLQWDANRDLMIYGTVSKGYRSAGFNSLATGSTAIFGSTYDPEFSWSYELGFKLDAFDRFLRLNVAAYHQELSDVQTLALSEEVAGSFIIQNAAKVQVRGVEVESTINPFDGLSLFGNVTYTHDKYKELDPGTQAAQANADRLQLISRWQWQVGGTYTLDTSAGEFAVSADYSHRDSYNSLTCLCVSSHQDPIGRMNGSISYKPNDKYEIYATATNLLGAKNWSASAEFIPGVFGYRIPLEPTVWKIGFKYKM